MGHKQYMNIKRLRVLQNKWKTLIHIFKKCIKHQINEEKQIQLIYYNENAGNQRQTIVFKSKLIEWNRLYLKMKTKLFKRWLTAHWNCLIQLPQRHYTMIELWLNHVLNYFICHICGFQFLKQQLDSNQVSRFWEGGKENHELGKWFWSNSSFFTTTRNFPLGLRRQDFS